MVNGNALFYYLSIHNNNNNKNILQDYTALKWINTEHVLWYWDREQ